VTHRVARWMLPSMIVALTVSGLEVPAFGQRPYYATPPPGSGPVEIEPYEEFGGCSEEPAVLQRCGREKAKAFTPPRTPEGVPDLQGFWGRIGARTANNIEEHAAGYDGTGGRSLIIDPPDGRIPYQAWARAKVDNHWEIYWNPIQECIPDTPPRESYTAGAIQVVQSPGYVFIMTEQVGTYRVIPTTPRPHVGSNIHLYMGDPRGRWEGNTLVVDVTNMKDRVWLDHMGNTFSESASLVERFTMFHQDVILYEVTITDPAVYTRPWTMAFGWRRNRTRGYQLMESSCWEGVQSWLRLFGSQKAMYRGGFAR